MQTETTTPPWSRFFFESNQFFQHINGPADWERLRQAYPKLSDEKLLAAKEATYQGSLTPDYRAKHPNYGFRLEHDGEKTLKDFFIEKGIPLPSQPPAEA